MATRPCPNPCPNPCSSPCSSPRPRAHRSRGRVHLLTALALLAGLALGPLVGPPSPAGAFPLLALGGPVVRGMHGCQSITTGSDGNLWFACQFSESLGRVTPAGAVTMFGGDDVRQPRSITSGPDGNLWFTSIGNNRIGRITPAGVITTFSDPAIATPNGITAGPDGALWFTGAASIGRITTAGAVTVFTGPKIASPNQLATGPDGNLWFTSPPSTIGRITPAGAVTTFTADTVSQPLGITAGPDGNLWFTNTTSGTIGRITTAGVISAVTVPGAKSPLRITAGPDGKLWFTDFESNAIGWLSPTTPARGMFKNAVSHEPYGITAGPDGKLWFTTDSTIGRVTTAGAITTATRTKVDDPVGVTTGADGNVWYANRASIGRVTPSGAVTVFRPAGISRLGGITRGPDGNVWFTDRVANAIGRITPAGEARLFTGPGIDEPTRITAGPDGNLWFTDVGTKPSIGRITPQGLVHVFVDAKITHPVDITPGPDGALWFLDDATDGVTPRSASRITTAGLVTSHPLGPTITAPVGIVAGPDGNLWITNDHNDFMFPPAVLSITRMTPSGELDTFTSAKLRDPREIVVGADGNLWFVNGSDVGRITMTGLITSYPVMPTGFVVSVGAGPDGNLWWATNGPNIGWTPVAPPRFSDVPLGAPFYADINWLAAKGIATGYPDGSFRPAAPVSRQAMAAFLYRFAGSPLGAAPPCPKAPFADVPKGAPFCGEITWLVGQGIAQGYPNGTFKPTAPVSRQAMAAFLYRLAVGGNPPACNSNAFVDVPPTNAFCGHIAWLAVHEIANGYPNGTFQPTASVSRQAMAAFLHRLSDLIYLNP